MIRVSMKALLATTLFAAACGGKTDSAATPADSTAVTPAAATDSATVTEGAAKPAADSAMAPSAAKMAPKQETGDYDQPIKPRFKVDEKTGKIDTIKRP